MNKRVIVYVLGAVLLIEAALMLLPLLVAVIYRERTGWYFFWVLLGAAVLGEKFGLQSLFGAALIVGGIVISHLQTPAPGRRLRRQPAAGDAAGKQLCSK